MIKISTLDLLLFSRNLQYTEKLLNHDHHKLHWGVVIIEHHDLVHSGWSGALGTALQHHRASRVFGWRDGALRNRLRRFAGHAFILSGRYWLHMHQ